MGGSISKLAVTSSPKLNSLKETQRSNHLDYRKRHDSTDSLPGMVQFLLNELFTKIATHSVAIGFILSLLGTIVLILGQLVLFAGMFLAYPCQFQHGDTIRHSVIRFGDHCYSLRNWVPYRSMFLISSAHMT